MLYQMVELKEGAEIQYLGVYALKWRHDEWGPPSVGFVERNVFNLVMTYLCAHCGVLAEVPFLEVEVFDSGTILTCNRCGEDTVFDLDTPGKLDEELRALQELVAVRDSELAEMRQIVGMLGDQGERLDSLTKAVNDQLRAERDEARAALAEIWDEVQGAFDRDIIYTAARAVCSIRR